MSIRVLAGQKPDAALSKTSDGASGNSEPARENSRRRRHTPEHYQDRFLRILSRVLAGAGILMILWLLMRALGWV